MFHTLAMQATLTLNGVNIPFTAVSDDIIPRNPTTGTFMLPEDMYLYAASAFSAFMSRTRFSSASLRQINQPFIRPVTRAADLANKQRVALFTDQPFRVRANEELTLEGTSAVNPGPETGTAFLWVGKSLDPVPPGDILTCRATSTVAAVANTWTSTALTLDQTLPPGMYALVATEHISATALAHRWIIPNQFYRPGFLSTQLVSAYGQFEMMQRYFGVLGQFLNTVLPIPQVFCTGADASHEFYLQVIKLQ